MGTSRYCIFVPPTSLVSTLEFLEALEGNVSEKRLDVNCAACNGNNSRMLAEHFFHIGNGGRLGSSAEFDNKEYVP